MSPKPVRSSTHVGVNLRLVCVRACVRVCTRALFLSICQMLYSPEALKGNGAEGGSLQPARRPPPLLPPPPASSPSGTPGRTEPDLLTSEPKRPRSLCPLWLFCPPSWGSWWSCVHPAGCRLPPAGSEDPPTAHPPPAHAHRLGKCVSRARSRVCPPAGWIFWVRRRCQLPD